MLFRASCLHEALCQWSPSSNVALDQRGKSGRRHGNALNALSGQPIPNLNGIECTASPSHELVLFAESF